MVENTENLYEYFMLMTLVDSLRNCTIAREVEK